MGAEDIQYSKWRFGHVLFDETGGKLAINGQTVEIDRNCAALLAALLRRAGEPLGKDELLEIGWPGRIVHENSLAKAISRLRQALGEDGARVEAVYGSGYRLTGPVKRLDAPPPEALETSGVVRRLRAHLFGDRRRAMMTCAITVASLSLLVAGLATWWAMTAQAQLAEQERKVEVLLTFLSTDVLAAADPYAP